MRRKLCRHCVCYLLAGMLSLCLLALAATASPPQYDQRLLGGLPWRMIGPFRGGRVVAVSGVPGQANVFYFGAVGGGVWKTTDAGRTWKPVFDSQPIASIGAVAVAPSDPNVVYAGSGEADMRSAIGYGNGVYKSTDAGRTWQHIGLTDSRQISRIVVDPRDANVVFVAALGHAYGANSERGVFRSRDGGKTWQRVLFRDENTGAADLAADPSNPKIIFAALWQTRRPPWSIYPPSNGPGSGLYRSRDGGDHWEQLTGHGLPSEGLGRMGIAVAPSNPRRIYLIADAKDGGVYRSDDGGENWQLVDKDRRIWGRGWYFGRVDVDSKDAETVYVSNTSLYRSRDGGKSFTAIKGAPGGDDYHGLWIDPGEPQRMILASDQGAVVTLNGGETWSSWYNQPTGQFYHAATDNRFPYWVYGAQQDSGPAATPSRGNYRALNFHDWRPLEAGEENGYMAPDPQDSNVIYGGFVARQDLRTEQTLPIPPTLMHPGEYRRTWTLPLVFSPRDPGVLYFGAQVLFRTADGGNSWQAISADLTREDAGVPANLDPATAADAPAGKRRGVIYTIAASPLRTGLIWIGTDDGLIQVTRDEGKSWRNVTPPEITSWSKVTHIEASHFDADTAYAAVDRHRLEDLQPYLYRTRDAGRTWQRASRGIPDGSFLNCIREDPQKKGLLYACTESGVFVSFNDGDDWQALQLNMPVVSVRDLVIHEDDLVIATHGRSFWVLDDASPLRQLDPQVAASDAWLFRPQIALRVRPGSDQGTPKPLDEPLAENPPDGAIFHYYLKEKPASPVILEILDAAGKAIRRFASDDKAPVTDPNSLEIPMYWVRTPEILSAEPGMHRLIWDLHYAGPAGLRGGRRGAQGPWAPPGNYTVRITVNGKPISQPVVLKMDPRVKTPAEDLARQFEISSQLAAAYGEASAANRQAERLLAQIDALGGKFPGDAPLAKALSSLSAKVRGLLGPQREAYGSFGLAVPAGENSDLRSLVRAFSTLLSIAESADAAPTSDVVAATAKFSQAQRMALAQWRELSDNELPRVNELLRQKNAAPLTLEAPRPQS